MGIFSRLFRRRKKKDSFNKPIKAERAPFLPIELIRKEVSSRSFISQKEYLDILEPHLDIKNQIDAVKKANMLTEYCLKHGISKDDTDSFLSFFDSQELRIQHNKQFLKEEEKINKYYLEHILDECDPRIKLDEDQIKVVLSDEDNTLVIAGAGAGKTTTVAAKAKYLVDKKGVDPKDILIISFTNKAVDELIERINKKLGLGCKISTFHRVGFELLNTGDEKKTVKDDWFLASVVREYLKTKILTDKNMASKILLFFASYLSLPPDFNMPLDEFFDYTTRNEFNTMRGDLKEYAEQINAQREKTQRTIKNERVASYQELQIANFLYINGIDYKYEDPYKFHIEGTNRLYLPDFHIFQNGKEAYLEHFGMVSDKGANSSRTQYEIDKYIKAIKDKVQLHKQHGTMLLKTFGEYSDGRDIVEHLKEELIKHGFELSQRNEEEILSQIISSEQNKYIGKLIKLVTSFIEAYKTNGYGAGHFKMLRRKTSNARDKLFLDICEGAYNYYQNELKINYAIDFSDMINDSVEIIKTMQENSEKIPYKYIIVDEYQDISHQRYNLTKELSKIADAKIVAVGDDWQSIYAFSGSDITLFTEFKKCILNPRLGCELLYINNTYRNAQELIDIAGTFVLRNTTQINKSLKSPKNLKDPVIIYSYCDDDKKIEEQGLRNSRFQKAHTLEAILDKLVAENPSILDKAKDKEPILLIGRFNFDAEHLSVGDLKDEFGFRETETEPYNIFDYNHETRKVTSKKYPTLRMAFMTAHSSKGLTYDNVIIINGLNGTNGFPSKKEDDPVMDLVVKRDRAIEYAEERRLFYVALTRTSNRVYIIAPETRPSEFVTELINDKGYKHITVKGVFNEKLEKKDVYYCPDCGFPLKYFGNSNIGLPLYVCSNEHELCGFMSNDIKGGRLRICECDECMNGYMIVKKMINSNSHFLGCTNYTKDRKGCNHTISIQEFDKLFPRGETKQYTPQDLANREAFKYRGEKIEHLENKNIVQNHTDFPEREQPKMLKTPTLNNNHQQAGDVFDSLVEEIKNHCLAYSDIIECKERKSKVSYTKIGNTFHWFWIDLQLELFCYKSKTLNDKPTTISVSKENLNTILKAVDSLISNHYEKEKVEKAKKDEKKTSQTLLLQQGTQEQKNFYYDFKDWVLNNFDNMYYVNMYGVHQFWIKDKNKIPLFWFSLENGTLYFKYRSQTIEKEKPQQMAIDLFDTTELYKLAKKLIEANKN